MKRQKPSKETVRIGNASVRIYSRSRTIAGKRYVIYEVCDYVSSPGKRKLRSFNDHQAAIKEAQRLARLLSTGDATAAAMSGKEAASFGRCLEILRPVGVAPELACAIFAEATGIIGNATLLPAAARFYVERHPNTMPKVTLEEAAEEMIELRRKANASGPYLDDLKSRTGRFLRTFVGFHPASLTTADCQRYLNDIEGANSTRRVHRQVVWRLLSHCESHGYIPKGSNPMDGVKPPSAKRDAPIQVWTPQEMAKLLAAASPSFLPVLLLGGFAGLRTSEIMALHWQDVRLAERAVKIVHRKLRCAGSRLAPITDNLLAWLGPIAKKSGPVWASPGSWRERERSMTLEQNRCAEAAGLLPWRHNGLRHSFCSYRVALTQDVPRTALEAGNSAPTIFQHYRALATQAEGQEWFSILPATPAR